MASRGVLKRGLTLLASAALAAIPLVSGLTPVAPAPAGHALSGEPTGFGGSIHTTDYVSQDRSFTSAGVANLLDPNPTEASDGTPLPPPPVPASVTASAGSGPLQGAAILRSDLSGSPLAKTTLVSLHLETLPVDIALSTIPIQRATAPHTWQELLASTVLAGIPLQNVTWKQVHLLSGAGRPAALDTITMADVDWSGSVLADLPLAAFSFGGTDITSVHIDPLPGEPAPTATNADIWCYVLNKAQAGACPSAAALAGQSLIGIGVRGAPLKDIPLKDIPLKDIDVAASPLKDIPLKDIVLNVAPLKDIPLKDINVVRLAAQGHPAQGHRPSHIAAQGHPAQGHRLGQLTAQGHPAQGHQPRHIAAQGHPAQGHRLRRRAAQGHPAQGHQPRHIAAQGHPAQGHRLRRRAAQGHPAQGHQPRHIAAQGHPAQGHRPGGCAAQGHPAQGHRVRHRAAQGHPAQGHRPDDVRPGRPAPLRDPMGVCPAGERGPEPVLVRERPALDHHDRVDRCSSSRRRLRGSDPGDLRSRQDARTGRRSP